MSSSSSEHVMDNVSHNPLPAPPPQEEPTTPFPPLKGRKKLLNGFQRISSSQSLLRLGRNRSSTYNGSGRGSISCISLQSADPSAYNYQLGSSYGSPFSNGFSTAPTSAACTPGVSTPSLEGPSRVRFLKHQAPLSVPLPSDLRSAQRPQTSAGTAIIEEDYFSIKPQPPKSRIRRPNFDFWNDMPVELKGHILQQLHPREIVKCSRVSKSWYNMCFDGQLWANLDTASFYRDIPADALVKIISQAGPFARDLNLRGCIQLWDRWRTTALVDACTNLENLSLEGCRIERSSIHNLLYQNSRLVHINISGLGVVTNTTLKIIAQQCPKLEFLNVSWCYNACTRGLQMVVESCPNLRDLRAGEIRGFADKGFMLELFKRNTLERLILMNCDTLTDESLVTFFEGAEAERDCLTDRAIVPPRKLKHLDISRCRLVSDTAILAMAHNMPELEGLQLAKCSPITDHAMAQLLPTLPNLTHLDLEELDQLTNATLQGLAKAPCNKVLQHLSISYCEGLGDTGMLPVIKECKALRSLELDNTRISDLVLIEAATAVRARPTRFSSDTTKPAAPQVGLSMVVYDCQNVTWTGIREVLSRNAETRRPIVLPLPSSLLCHAMPTGTADSPSAPRPATPLHKSLPTVPTVAPPHAAHQVIALKVFYGYQPTVTEHTRRVLHGDLLSAQRLERRWAEYMIASEEAGAPGGFGPAGFGMFGGVAGRRRRRRIREAAMMHADEEGEMSGEGGVGGIGRRRRARSGGGCTVM